MRYPFTAVWLCFLSLVFTASGAEPVFVDPPSYVGPPRARHAVTNRAFQGIPSLAVAPRGRLWAVWYAGKTPGEDRNNYVTVTTSGDNGTTWKEVTVIDPDAEGPVRAFDPEVWMAPDGSLRVFWAQAVGHNATVGGVWMMKHDDPESASPRWGAPVRVTDGVMMCKPLVLSSGEWVLPASTWRATDDSAKMLVSEDAGNTWSIRGACHVPKKDRSFDEHLFIERRDGSLWLLARTRYGIGESVSTDRGTTWPALAPSGIAHPSARFFIRRLASGNLLLVKHGPIDRRTGRSHLTAFVSGDDGTTWGGGLMLDERAGVSYPDGQQAADGLIRIIYDYRRTTDRRILMAAFREEDAAAGKDVSGKVALRQPVSTASGGIRKKKKPGTPRPVKANADGAAMDRKEPGAWAREDGAAVAFEKGATLFADRSYTLAECPPALKGARFLRVKIDGRKTLRCSRAGAVFALTPRTDRNRDSVSGALLRQGFSAVKLPEVRLFDPANTANYCTLYQKKCKAGESITFGKWAVPLFFNPITAHNRK